MYPLWGAVSPANQRWQKTTHSTTDQRVEQPKRSPARYSDLPFFTSLSTWNQCRRPRKCLLMARGVQGEQTESAVRSALTPHFTLTCDGKDTWFTLGFCSGPASLMSSLLLSTHQNCFHRPRPRPQPALLRHLLISSSGIQCS